LALARISFAEQEDFRREARGILLGDNAHCLVQCRLGRMVNDAGVASLGDRVGQLRREPMAGHRAKRLLRR
jgi:hypothetical protein